MSFGLGSEVRGGVTVVKVTGDLTTCAASDRLIALFEELFGLDGSRSFVVDLSVTRRLRQEGATALNLIQKKCRGCGRIGLVVGVDNQQVQRKLEELGFDLVFDIFADLETALRTFEVKTLT